MKLFLLSFLFVFSAQASSEVSKWSLRYMARASNLLLVSFDSALENKPLLCGLKKDEPQTLSQNLKALIDEKVQILSAEQKRTIASQAETCEKECTCDILMMAIEKPSEKLTQKASAITSEQRSQCAQNFQEFCKSQLLKKIR